MGEEWKGKSDLEVVGHAVVVLCTSKRDLGAVFVWLGCWMSGAKADMYWSSGQFVRLAYGSMFVASESSSVMAISGSFSTSV